MRMTSNERGGSRAKLIIFIVIFAVLAYVGYLYIPVSIDAYYFKDTMQNTVNLAVTQGYDTAWVTDQLKKGGREYHVPEDAVITPAQRDNRVEVRVQFTRPISTPEYTYTYESHYTSLRPPFLTIQ